MKLVVVATTGEATRGQISSGIPPVSSGLNLVEKLIDIV
jgi:hypothetical protein